MLPMAYERDVGADSTLIRPCITSFLQSQGCFERNKKATLRTTAKRKKKRNATNVHSVMAMGALQTHLLTSGFDSEFCRAWRAGAHV